jgi:hypothetical protein
VVRAAAGWGQAVDRADPLAGSGVARAASAQGAAHVRAAPGPGSVRVGAPGMVVPRKHSVSRYTRFLYRRSIVREVKLLSNGWPTKNATTSGINTSRTLVRISLLPVVPSAAGFYRKTVRYPFRTRQQLSGGRERSMSAAPRARPHRVRSFPICRLTLPGARRKETRGNLAAGRFV